MQIDLIYLIEGKSRTMACSFTDDNNVTEIIGPFPAAESGPKIVAALVERNFGTAKDIETQYMIMHFGNMSRGFNNHGIDYPMRLAEKE